MTERDRNSTTDRPATEPRTNWRIEEDEDGYWSLLYTGDGVTTPIHGFTATIPREDEARLILDALVRAEAALGAAPRAEGLDVHAVKVAVIAALRESLGEPADGMSRAMRRAIAADVANRLSRPSDERDTEDRR